MWLAALGPLCIEADGDVRSVTAAKPRVVLAALLLRANHVVPVEELVDAVWDGSPPATAPVTIRNYIKQLRRQLNPDAAARITTRSPGYLIELADDELDLLRFASLYQLGRDAIRKDAWPEASLALHDALGLWRGDALVDVPSQKLHREHVPPLEEMRLQALEWRIDADLRLGRHAEMIPELRSLTSGHPLRERYHGQLMHALHQSGRRGEALAAYAAARDVLVGELGVEPAAELRELHERILQADAGLPASPLGGGSQRGVLRGAPKELPNTTRYFIGRAAHLAFLDDLARQAAQSQGPGLIALVTGMAGVGKTTLAVHWAHQAAALFPDGQLYMDLRGSDPAAPPIDPAQAVRELLVALGVGPRQIPVESRSQNGLYRSVIANKRMLVILDNAKDSAQVRPLLPGAAGCMVLITSRNEMSGLIAVTGAQPLVLDVLNKTDAARLLESRLGIERVAAEPGAADAVIQLCAGLPLALVIAAARATVRPGAPLAWLAQQLLDRGRRLEILEAEPGTASVRSAFSWSYQQLSAPAATLLRGLTMHPGPDITVRAAASLGGLSLAETNIRLTELSRAYLIVEHVPGRFSLHDLVHLYAATEADQRNSLAERRATIHRVLDHYLHTAWSADRLLNPARDPIPLQPPQPAVTAEELGSHEEAMAWFSAEFEVLLASLAMAVEAGFDRHAWQLPWAMVDFLERRGHWHEWVSTQRIALGATERLADLSAQARACRGLGCAHSQLGSYDDARTHLARALALYRETGDLVGQGRVHQDLSVVSDRDGRPGDALHHDQRALLLYRESGHRAGQATALNAIGWLHSRLGDHQQALSSCVQALALHRESGNRRGEAATLDSIGYASHHLGQNGQAVARYLESVGLFRELGDRYNEADVLTHLGDAQRSSGDARAARDAWDQALAILVKLKHPDAEQVRVRLATLAHDL